MSPPPGTANDGPSEVGTAGISDHVTVTAPVPSPHAPVRLRFSAYSIVRAVLVVVVAIGLLALVAAASTTLWWLAIATAVAGFLQPASLLLRRYMPGWLAILIVLLGVVAVVGLIGYRGFAEISEQFTILQTNAIESAREIESSEQFGQVATEFGLTAKVTDLFDSVPLNFSDSSNAFEAAQSAASSGGALFAIAMLALLMAVFGRRLAVSAVAQIDDRVVRARVKHLLITSYTLSSEYVWLMFARAVGVGVLVGLVSALLGVKAPTALGVWFGLLSLLPGLGIVIAALPLVLVQSISSPSLALAIAILAVALQLADVIFVQRRIDQASVQVGPALTTIAVLIGVQLYGIGGAMVMLALSVFGVAALRTVTRGHEDVFTALRTLVSPDAAVHVGG